MVLRAESLRGRTCRQGLGKRDANFRVRSSVSCDGLAQHFLAGPLLLDAAAFRRRKASQPRIQIVQSDSPLYGGVLLRHENPTPPARRDHYCGDEGLGVRRELPTELSKPGSPLP